jgi:hypothetical protein
MIFFVKMEKLGIYIENFINIYILDHIDIMKYKYRFNFLYDGYTTQLLCYYDLYSETYKIEIENDENEQYPCLILNLYLDKNGKDVAEVQWIRTLRTKCKIPSSDGGDWIMRLVDSIICQIGIARIILMDGSYILCQDNKIDLTKLRIYKGKYSWYKNFGYEIIEQQGITKKIYYDAIEQYINIPMNQIYETTTKYFPCYDILEIFKIYKIEPNQTLSAYMRQLYALDCSSYIQMESFLSETSTSQYNFIWSQPLNIIESTTEYEKLLNCDD